MKMYHFFGFNNTIVKELFKRNDFINYKIYNQVDIKNLLIKDLVNTIEFKKNIDNVILYSWGKLYPASINNQTFEEKLEGFIFNYLIPVSLIDHLNTSEFSFNFIYISSESAKKGSFDSNYASQKAATEMFIRECQLLIKKSILVGVAPSMIIDSGMTQRRNDIENVFKAEKFHPKKRLLYTNELVDLIEYLMHSNTYISNTIIEMNGGKFARMKIK
jgi:NAD(P)-dependent dehydrogenase (short-subunit alcohol dehydrogenase family)